MKKRIMMLLFVLCTAFAVIGVAKPTTVSAGFDEVTLEEIDIDLMSWGVIHLM